LTEPTRLGRSLGEFEAFLAEHSTQPANS